MACYFRALPTTAAGGLITLLDEVLPYNANWSIYDAAAAANCKVYKCATAGAEFYLYCDDNNADYAKMAVYETWDAGAHAGGGTNTGATDLRWRKAGPTVFCVNDTRVIYLNNSGAYSYGFYAGQLKRFVPGKNTPVLIGSHPSTTSGQNPIASGGTYSTNVIWLAANFDSAVVRNAYVIAYNTTTGALNAGAEYFKAYRQWYVQENIVMQGAEALVLGQLDGAMAMGTSSQTNGANLMQKRILVDGVQWICWVSTNISCWVRLD